MKTVSNIFKMQKKSKRATNVRQITKNRVRKLGVDRPILTKEKAEKVDKYQQFRLS